MSDEAKCTNTTVIVCGLTEKAHGYLAPHVFGTEDSGIVWRDDVKRAFREQTRFSDEECERVIDSVCAILGHATPRT